MAPIGDLVDDCAPTWNLAVVEDACQATGAIINGLHVPAPSGDVGVVSFGGSKLLTAGRGGAILSRRPEVVQRVEDQQ